MGILSTSEALLQKEGRFWGGLPREEMETRDMGGMLLVFTNAFPGTPSSRHYSNFPMAHISTSKFN